MKPFNRHILIEPIKEKKTRTANISCITGWLQTTGDTIYVGKSSGLSLWLQYRSSSWW